MARTGANTHPPSYTTQIPVVNENKSLKRETKTFADTASSSAIKPGVRVSKEGRQTGKRG